MEFGHRIIIGALCVFATCWGAHAQDAANPGRDMVLGKCFQCHADSMFRDQRQERRAWEAAIYRMIGRGALFTPEEIKLIADYLGTDFGPNAKPAAAAK